MKCLSIWQPWASLIGCGYKTVETRSWSPPVAVVGTRIGIHASLRKPSTMGLTAYLIGAIERAAKMDNGLQQRGLINQAGFGRLGVESLDELPRGCVVCTAVVKRAWRIHRIRGPMGGAIACGFDNGTVDQSRIERRVDRFGDFTPGRWIWELEDVRTLDEPVVVRGRQRLFEVEMNEGKQNG